jgi:hypothetical protein
MRLRIALVVLALAVSAPVVAAEKPAMDIPVYPGGEANMEINLTSEDLLPTLEAMLPLLKIGGPEGAIDPNEIAAAFKDVRRIQFLQLDIAKNPTEAAVADYYAKNLPAGQWSRVFWQKAGSTSTAFYVQGAGEKLYGFRVTSEKADEKPIKRVQILKTEGKIDFAKLLVIAAKAFAH